jgi:hypothetical protein
MIVMSMIVAMTVVTMIVVAVRVLSVFVMRSTVTVDRGRHGGADRGRTVKRPQSRDESTPLHPQQSHSDQDDERIAHDFDSIDRAPIVAAVAFNSTAATPTRATATRA